MFKTRFKTAAIVATAGVLLAGGGALAAPVTTLCPGTAATADREFSVTIEGPAAAGCVLWGAGNVGTSNPSNPGDQAIAGVIGDSVLLDKSDGASQVAGFEITTDPLNSGLSGTWAIALPVDKILTNVFLAFKSGQGQLDPDWALFSLPDGVLEGNWAIAAGEQALSHVNLYGTVASAPPPAPVPLPAGGLLLLGALGGMAALRRRRG